MSLYSVLNQKLYPGAGDLDDCWVVATCWAARIAGVRDLPTVTEFRKAANKPDLPGPSGGSITDIMRAVRKLWPDLGVQEYERPDWDAFALALRGGKVASLGVMSSQLPRNLRFGFNGAHQIGVVYQGRYLVANPLAPQGSEPIPISETALRNAARALAMGWILAALFPTGDAMTINSTDRLVRSSHVRDIKAGTAFYSNPTTKLGAYGSDVTLDDYGYPVGTGSDFAAVRVRANLAGDGDLENGIVYVRTADPGVGPVRRRDADELRAAAATFYTPPTDVTPFTKAQVDAAYNEGRDAVVNAAATVPRR